jgi:uncharacterized protein YjbI with pentapeptide repeats
MIEAWAVLAAVLAIIAFSVIVIGVLIGPLANWIAGREQHLSDEKRADIRTAARDTLLKAAGGLVLLLGAVGTVGTLAYTAQTARASQEAAQAAQNQVSVAHDSQVTDSFATAINQLASNAADERLGGIYELEHVMRESHQDQPAAINVLADFVREHSTSSNPSIDILAALTVIARRNPTWDSNPVDLDGAHLDNAELPGAHFRGANLSGAFMGGIELPGADLRQADLGSADVSGADLNRAVLRGANLNGGADLSGTTIIDADLRNANLTAADLTGANLRGADFGGANLDGANLRGARGLTKEQLAAAHLDRQTKLPAGL